ncbi:uncharacterized protein Bfra_008714 [Botrytis fragariae]|uniref:SnoaL-like domain-containing protein n=1 Tax=Botrytis fragariae TaxID=1964551 RepID=A0A8H6AQV5_9HELO|nr:uncharacterized protein Bfra_008714 [Botrytis fragariae]KAF5871690.1 hypothetical protein Bfra_008714 [Botrytis fragariae]
MQIPAVLLTLALLPGALSWSPFDFLYNPTSAQYVYSPIEQIRYTLAFETFILDSKNWTALEFVYTNDAIANFTGLGAELWIGRDDIIANEKSGLSHVTDGVHQLTSSAVLINQANSSEAHVTTYITFNHFDTNTEGTQTHVFSAWFKFEDDFVDTKSFDGTPSSWRVQNRQMVLVGGGVGDDLAVERP